MDINNINDVAYAWASHERNEANRGKGVRSKGWVTKEQMRKDAAQKALGIMIAIAALTILVSIFIKIFGKVTGTIMMIVLVLGFPICYLIQESTGYNIQWLPLWIVAFALALKLFTKMFGRKWGLRIGIPIVGIIALIVYLGDEPSNARTSQSPRRSYVAKHTAPAQQFADAKAREGNGDDNAEDDMNKLIRRIESRADSNSFASRVHRIRDTFDHLKNSRNAAGKLFTDAEALDECYKLAKVYGWIADDDQSDIENNRKNLHDKEVFTDEAGSPGPASID